MPNAFNIPKLHPDLSKLLSEGQEGLLTGVAHAHGEISNITQVWYASLVIGKPFEPVSLDNLYSVREFSLDEIRVMDEEFANFYGGLKTGETRILGLSIDNIHTGEIEYILDLLQK